MATMKRLYAGLRKVVYFGGSLITINAGPVRPACYLGSSAIRTNVGGEAALETLPSTHTTPSKSTAQAIYL